MQRTRQFVLGFRQRRLMVDITGDEATYTVVSGRPLEISHHGQTVRIETDEPMRLSIPAAPHREEATQPLHRSPTDALADPEGDTRD